METLNYKTKPLVLNLLNATGQENLMSYTKKNFHTPFAGARKSTTR
jgi:hypothetical protein